MGLGGVVRVGVSGAPVLENMHNIVMFSTAGNGLWEMGKWEMGFWRLWRFGIVKSGNVHGRWNFECPLHCGCVVYYI